MTSYPNVNRTLGSPMAESSQIGRSPVRQSGTAKRKPTSPLQRQQRTLFRSSSSLVSNLSRIDPQVYTDAQSRGLVNRLVKYYDRSSSMPRSHSLSSVYTKPGQFPVVHLRKHEIKYSPRRNNSIPCVRIAPPEKSVFQANTRSNILRAGSYIVPTEPRINESDVENRVITPCSEVESMPTKSVLDALKEISRKRINSEELDADRLKKQCKEPHEVVDGIPTSSYGLTAKRTRERAGSVSPPSGPLVNGDQQTGAQIKRFCSKNNDILSSLSSSLITPKRLAIAMPMRGRLNVDQTYGSLGASPMMMLGAPFNATVADVREINKPVPEPAPTVAAAAMAAAAVVAAQRKPSPPSSQSVVAADVAAPVVAVPAVSARRQLQEQGTQPKITLFNKKYDESVVRAVSSDEEDEDGGKIHFVKPKEKSTMTGGEKDSLKRVEKSKLSVMLKCLSGDLDDEDEDTTDKVGEGKDTLDAPAISLSPIKPLEPASKPATSAASPPTGFSALINNPIKDAGLGKINLPPGPVVNAVKTTEAETKTPVGGFTFGATPTLSTAITSTTATVTASNTPVTTAKPTASVTFGSLATSAPVSATSDAPPAYNFPSIVTTPSTGNTSLTTATSTTSNLISFSPMPKAGSEKPVTTATGLTPTAPTFGTGGAFSAFKTNTLASSTASPAATSAPEPSANTNSPTTNTFTFGSKTTPIFGSTLSAGAGSTVMPVFGATTPAVTTTTATTAGNTITTSATTAPAVPVFGGSSSTFGTSTAPVFNFTSPSNTTLKPTFGVATAAAPAPAATVAPVTTVATTSTATVTAPVFGGLPTTAAAAKSFFGAPADPRTATMPIFGNTPISTTASAQPIFGAAAASTENAIPSFISTTMAPMFGSPATTVANPTPVFGAAASAAATVTSPSLGNSAFTFGASKQAPAATSVATGATAIPSFGSVANAGVTPSATAPPNDSAVSLFGVTAPPANAFGGIKATQPAPAPTFGGTGSMFTFSATPTTTASAGVTNQNSQPAPIFGNGSLNNTFTFGTPTAAPATTVAPPPSSSTLGNNNSPSPFTFGTGAAAPAPKPTQVFGSASAPVPTFGAAPVFGSPNSRNTNAVAPTTGNAIFGSSMFGSPSATNVNNQSNSAVSNIFGGQIAPKPAQATNVAVPNNQPPRSNMFQFGASVATNNSTSNKPFAFGSNNANVGSPSPLGGGGAGGSVGPTDPSANVGGNNAMKANSFTFATGMNGGTPVPQQAPQLAGGTKAAAFTFGAANSSPFGVATASPAPSQPTFSFNASNNSNVNNGNVNNNAGNGGHQQPVVVTKPPAFTFNANTATGPAPAFNFTANAGNPVPVMPAPVPGAFNFNAGGGGPVNGQFTPTFTVGVSRGPSNGPPGTRRIVKPGTRRYK